MNLLARTLITSARTSSIAGGCMLLASTAHRGAPWAGINGMTNALALGSPRPSAHFQGEHTLLGLGVLCGGLMLMSGLYELVLSRTPAGRGVISGTAFALAGYGIDRLLPAKLLKSFEHGMGPVGTFAKYAALAVAAALPTRD